MAKSELKVWRCVCDGCGHIWVTKTYQLPKVCPKCKRRNWDKESPVTTDIKDSISIKRDIESEDKLIIEPVATFEFEDSEREIIIDESVEY